jgi:hypothetical protein
VSQVYEEAKKELRFREGQIAEGKHPGPHIAKVLFDDLARLIENDYIVNRKRTLEDVKRHIKRLEKHFKGMPAAYIDTDKIDKFIRARLADGLTNAAINRELSALKKNVPPGSEKNATYGILYPVYSAPGRKQR